MKNLILCMSFLAITSTAHAMTINLDDVSAKAVPAVLADTQFQSEIATARETCSPSREQLILSDSAKTIDGKSVYTVSLLLQGCKDRSTQVVIKRYLVETGLVH